MPHDLSFHANAQDVEMIQRVRHLLTGPGALFDEPSEVLLAPHDVRVFLYAARAPSPHLHGRCQEPEMIHGAGCGLSRTVAQASAFGEVIERYSAWRCCTTETLQASYRELDSEGVDPRRFALYADAQYAQAGFHFQPAHDQTRLAWVQGWSWTYERPVYIPACFVYQLPCPAATGCLFHPVSTGLACGMTDATAILSGLCEVVERDAIMIAWLVGLELPRLRPPDDDAVLVDLYERISAKHLQATVLDATTDVGLPVRIALLENRRGRPVECAVGMAARPDPILAHRKALLEAVHTLNWLHQLQKKRPQLPETMASLYPETFEDHVFLYGHAWSQDFLDVWRNGPWHEETRYETSGPEPPARQLAVLVRRLAEVGLEVLTVDVTLPDVAEAGFRVFRSVVPGMVPLTMGKDTCLGGTRLRTVPEQLAWHARYGPGRWNPYPHPFP